MIKTVAFERGKAHFVDLKKTTPRHYWTDLDNPSKHELELVSEKTGIPVYEMNLCLDRDEKARVENEKDYALIIFRAPRRKSEKEITVTSAGIFVSKMFTVTIHLDPIGSIGEALKEPEMFIKKGFPYLTYSILLHNVRQFDRITDDIGDMLDKIETRLLKNYNIQVDQIFNVKKTLLYFRKALVTNRDAAFLLYKGSSPFLNSKSLFADLHTETAQQVDEEEILRARITEAVSIYLSSSSNKLNEVMKSFTVIASLLLIPMLISGIYGMNFQHIPLAFHTYGFYMTIGMMALTVFIALFFFKRQDWI